MSVLMEYDPLKRIQEYQPAAMELEGQEAFKRLLRNRGEMQQLFQSPQWKILVEYLLSERNEAVNNMVYQDMKIENHFAYGLEVGKIRMIDAFIDMPKFVQQKLKEEQKGE